MSRRLIFISLCMSLLALSLIACTRTIPGITAPATATTAPLVVVTAVRPSVTTAEAAAPTASAAATLVASPTTAFTSTPQLHATATLILASATASLPAPTQTDVAQPDASLATPADVTIQVVAANDLPERPTTYKVRKGEYVFCLARRFDVDPGQLMALNGLTINDVLRVGDVLNIPGAGSYPGRRAALRHPDVYVVQPGDTLYTIACQYGDLDPDAILTANGLDSAKAVKVGLRLKLPEAIAYADSEFGTGGAYQPNYTPYTYNPPAQGGYVSPYYYYARWYWYTPYGQPPYYDDGSTYYPPQGGPYYDPDTTINPNVTIVPLDPQP